MLWTQFRDLRTSFDRSLNVVATQSIGQRTAFVVVSSPLPDHHEVFSVKLKLGRPLRAFERPQARVAIHNRRPKVRQPLFKGSD